MTRILALALGLLLAPSLAAAKTVPTVCLKYRVVVTIAGIGIVRCVGWSAPAPRVYRRSDLITDFTAARRRPAATPFRAARAAAVHRVRPAVRHARAGGWRQRGHGLRARGVVRPVRVARPEPPTAAGPNGWLIAFSGVGGAIDAAAAQRVAMAQGRALRVFSAWQAREAVAFLVRHQDAPHSVLAFSLGASASTLRPFVAGLDETGLPLPVSITTVGLSRRSPAFNDARIPTVHYLDRSGQGHAGERNVVNLGAGVSHLDPRAGAMARVAAIAEQVAAPRVATAPETPVGAVVDGLASLPRMLGDGIASLLDALTEQRTAVYDISGHTVYLPNGERLEAHSGLGPARDNPRHAALKFRGPTPPNVYRLTMREAPFHGVRALRLNPLDETRMHGRDGILAHTYMRSGAQSAGCLVFRDYTKFLAAFERGTVNRIVVVPSLASDNAMADAEPPHVERPRLVAHRHVRHRLARAYAHRRG